ncbi:MAG: DUF3240 family protein [Lysobacter sp.]|nr:DUF3240 family protein [Lysobacter sp.]
MSDFVRLSLIFPPALENAVTDALIADPGLPGFTLFHAEGHTSHFANATVAERVRGRVERRILWVVVERERVEEVLDALRRRVASHDVRWWTEAILAHGRLA